jgi:hypothetical protein
MDPIIINEIALNSGLNANDISLLSQILNSEGTKGKMPKITPKDKNNLINKLSSTNTLNNQPQKELKDMNEEEKKIYRQVLKNKFKNKQNEKKMQRTNNSNINNYSDAISKLSIMMNEINGNDILNSQQANITEQTQNKIDLNKFNQLFNNEENKDSYNEDLDDYIK